MKRFPNRLIAVFTMLALFLQLCSPFVVLAQDAQTQKQQIQDAIDRFKPVHDDIMALKPIELGAFTGFAVDAVDTVKEFGADVLGKIRGESDEEKAAREQKEKSERARAQIEQANRDIADFKTKVKSVMSDLQSGDISAVQKADSTAAEFSSFQGKGSGLAKYKENLNSAGNALNKVGDMIDKYALMLGVVAGILTAVALIPGFQGVLAAVGPLTKTALVLKGVGAVIHTAGESLITAAAKGETTDRDFLGTLGREGARQGVEFAADVVTEKLGMGVVSSSATTGVVSGLTGTSREAERAGVNLTNNPGEVGKIALTEFSNAGVSAGFDILFAGMISGTSKGLTRDIMSDASMSATFNTRKSRSDFSDALEGVLGQAVGDVKSDLEDSAKEDVEEVLSGDKPENLPAAKSAPGLDGGGGYW